MCASGFKLVEAGILVKGKSDINIILSFNIVHCCYSHWSAWQAPDLMSLTCRRWYVNELLLIWIQLLTKVVRDIIPIQEILFLWVPHVKGRSRKHKKIDYSGQQLAFIGKS
jgi:hypothetical protein